MASPAGPRSVGNIKWQQNGQRQDGDQQRLSKLLVHHSQCQLLYGEKVTGSGEHTVRGEPTGAP